MRQYFENVYKDESYIMKKKADYIFFFILMMLLICVVGMIFHENIKDLLMYACMYGSFALAFVLLLRGKLKQVINIIVLIIPIVILSDILRFEFNSYEKIVETIMESFLSYLAVALFAVKKEHIIYTVVTNTCLTVLHAILIFHFTYSHNILPREGYKFLVGGGIAVLLAGLIVWFNFRVNEESLEISKRSNDELEQLVHIRTEDLKKANEDLQRINQELIKISTLDSLTGIFNRRKILEEASDMVNQRKQDGNSLIVVMIDIDYFKRVNDQYGHAAGDLAIKSVVDICKRFIKESDCMGRLGGEEFLLVLNEKYKWEAAFLMNQIRTVVENTIITSPNGIKFIVTISAGISYLQNQESLEELIHYADEALYESKRKGKNRVISQPLHREGTFI